MDQNHLNNFNRGHQRIIPVKFSENLSNGLEENNVDDLSSSCLTMLPGYFKTPQGMTELLSRHDHQCTIRDYKFDLCDLDLPGTDLGLVHDTSYSCV
jgi:hypothetical protein